MLLVTHVSRGLGFELGVGSEISGNLWGLPGEQGPGPADGQSAYGGL